MTTFLFFYVLERGILCLLRLHLLDQKYFVICLENKVCQDQKSTLRKNYNFHFVFMLTLKTCNIHDSIKENHDLNFMLQKLMQHKILEIGHVNPNNLMLSQ